MSCSYALLKLKYLFFGQPKFKHQLAKLYRQKFQNTIFYQTCISTLKYIKTDNNQFIQIYEQRQNSDSFIHNQRSTTNIRHYQNVNINFNQNSQTSHNNPQQIKSLPYSMEAMSIRQKQHLLNQLIHQSYMYLDLSDMLQGEDIQTYDSLIKQQIFDGRQSIIGQPTLNKRLRYFDSQALNLLKIYVKFCTRIVSQLRQQSNNNQNIEQTSFFYRLIIQLKATLLTKFPQSQLKNYQQLKIFIKEFNIMIQIIIYTISKKYYLTLEEQQFSKNFFTKQNIKSLVLYIVFSDNDFLKSVFQRFYNAILNILNKINNNLKIDDQPFIQQLKQAFINPKKYQKNKHINFIAPYKSNLQKILQKKSNFPFFKKSLKTLQTITSPKQPMKVLKTIYEVNKSISVEHNQFIYAMIYGEENNKNLINIKNEKQFFSQKTKQSNILSFLQPQNNKFSIYDKKKSRNSLPLQNDIPKIMKKYSFSRQIQCLIIKWLLSNKKQKLKFIITNCLMAFFFVNQNQLKDKKGSALMPFIQLFQIYLSNSSSLKK